MKPDKPAADGKLYTYQNSNMSLSCRGEVVIKGGMVVEVSFKGYPRTVGDGWTNFYRDMCVGEFVSDKSVQEILKYDGKHNVISGFYPL